MGTRKDILKGNPCADASASEMAVFVALCADCRKLHLACNTSERTQDTREIARNLFYAIISHDLKGPVSDIRQLSDALASNYEGIPDKDLKQALSEIQRAASGTSDLLDNLLMWSLNQKQNLRPQMREERLGDIVKAAVSNVNGKSVRIQVEGEVDTTVSTDRNMLTTCLRNLLRNAIRFSPEGGTIIIDVAQKSIDIRDQGPGMDAEILATLSKPGHLGLVITRELLEKMGGRLCGRNLPQGGCEMTIEL